MKSEFRIVRSVFNPPTYYVVSLNMEDKGAGMVPEEDGIRINLEVVLGGSGVVLRRRRGICVVAAVFMNGGAGPWTAAACGAVAREARSAAWRRWTGGTRGDQANTFSDPRARGPRRTQEDLGGPGRTLETRRTPTFLVLWKIHKEE